MAGTDCRVADDEPRYNVRIVDELERRDQAVAQPEPCVSDGSDAAHRRSPHEGDRGCSD
jgi:hypothetical protein